MERNLKKLLLRDKCEDYWAYNLINHSKVVDFENNGPCILTNPTKKENKGITFGSLLDTLVTDTKNFNKLYAVVDDNIIPSEKVQLFFKAILQQTRHSLQEIPEEYLLQLVNDLDVFPNCKKKETILNKINSYSEYYDICRTNTNRELVSRSTYESAVNCVDALVKSKMTSWIFDKKFEILYQIPIFSDLYGGTKCKLDMLCVDDTNKKIYPFDLKFSSFPENQFVQQAFYKFKYYREAELYENILKDLLSYNGFSDYEIEDFRFIVINDKTMTPIVYRFPIVYDEYNNLKIGNVKTVRPIKDVIEDIRWHIKLQEFDYDRSLYEKMMLCQNESSKVMYPEISII